MNARSNLLYDLRIYKNNTTSGSFYSTSVTLFFIIRIDRPISNIALINILFLTANTLRNEVV